MSTVNSQTAVLVREIYHDHQDTTNRLVMKFPLPSIGGGTPTAARLAMYCLGPASALATGIIIRGHTTTDVSWDETTSAEDTHFLSDITGYVEEQSLAALASSVGWKYFNIFTSGPGSIASAYAAAASQITVILNRTGKQSAIQVVTRTTFMGFYDEDTGYEGYFAGPEHATPSLRPYIEIEYEPGGSLAFFAGKVT